MTKGAAMAAVRDDRRPGLWRAVAVLLAGLVAGVLTAAPADAHARLTGSDPEDEDTVTDELEMIVLEFNEDVDLPQVEVLDPDGGSVVDGDAEDLGDVMEQPLGELTAHGTYTVEWRVVSQDDHPIEGDFEFEYEGPLPEAEPAQEEPADEEPDEPVEEPADEPADDADEEPVDEPADEELATEPAADTGAGGLPIGIIAAVVVIGLAAAAFFALRGRGAGDEGTEA